MTSSLMQRANRCARFIASPPSSFLSSADLRNKEHNEIRIPQLRKTTHPISLNTPLSLQINDDFGAQRLISCLKDQSHARCAIQSGIESTMDKARLADTSSRSDTLSLTGNWSKRDARLPKIRERLNANWQCDNRVA